MEDAIGFGLGAVGIIILIAIGLLPYIFYLLTMQRLLQTIRPQNRTTEPGNVWLMFIPLFNIVYQFLLVGYVADSIVNELNSRNEPIGPDPRPTYQLGLWKCITGLLAIIPIIGVLAGLASLVLWIVYWVKLSEWKNRLLAAPTTINSNSGLLDS